MSSLWKVSLRPDLDLSLGTGRGSTFSTATHPDIPAPTLRGAFSASWWRTRPSGSQTEFDDLLRTVCFSNATFGTVAPLDLAVCKYHEVPNCDCGANLELAKGKTSDSHGVKLITQTRVRLEPNETADEQALFQRQALVVEDAVATCYVRSTEQDLTRLGVVPGTVIRVGRAKSVSGRCTVTAVEPFEREPVQTQVVRLEMRTPGIFVDEWGFASGRPDDASLEGALGCPATLVKSYVRWTTVGGWHAKSNRPKPEDPAVIPGSVFVVELKRATRVPGLVNGLGLRSAEGYGWAWVRGVS